MHNLIINGISLLDIGVAISGEGTYNAPPQSLQRLTIPGRSGDLLMTRQQTWQNITVTFPAIIKDDLPRVSTALRQILTLAPGYSRIEDDYHPDEYRLGVCAEGLEIEPGALNRYGKARLSFDCQPQRWLQEGETWRAVKSGEEVYNKWMPAKPVLRLEGSGPATLRFGWRVCQIADLPGTLILDLDTQLATDGAGRQAGHLITWQNQEWPILQTGLTTLKYSGGAKKMEMKPRWWRL